MAEECDVAETNVVKEKHEKKDFLCGVVEGSGFFFTQYRKLSNFRICSFFSFII